MTMCSLTFNALRAQARLDEEADRQKEELRRKQNQAAMQAVGDYLREGAVCVHMH